MVLPESIMRNLEEKKVLYKLSEAKFKALIALAEKQYEKAKVAPGEAVGVVAAQSIGEPGTQLNMRTKWLSGARDTTTTGGLPRLIELFDAKRVPSTPVMIIYLNSKYVHNEDEVRKIAMNILEVNLSDIAQDISVDLGKMRVEIELNPESMKYFKITEKKVYEKISEQFKGYKITTGSGKINVKPKDELDLKSIYKLKVKLRDTYISGIKGITQVLPDKQGDNWIIKTAGSNLREVLKMPEVDIKNTKTNDIFETLEVLGIEAARNLIVEEIYNVLVGQNIYSNVRHFMLVADLMTSDGTIKSVGRYGLSGSKSSVLARASFEVPLKHLFGAALHGEVDPLESVVENVMLNQPVPVGTGVVDLFVESPKLEDKKGNKR